VLADTPVYDHMTGLPTDVFFIPNNAGTPTGSGNRQMGEPVNLSDPNNLTLTGVDLTWVNSTGAAVTLDTTHRLKLNYWVWNQSFVAANATYAGLAGTGSVIYAPATAQTINNNTYINFGSLTAAGTVPAIPFTTPITVTSNNAIGFAFNWQIDPGTGTFGDVLGSTLAITGGTGANGGIAPPPVVGTSAFAGPTFGYYRSAAASTTDNNGNFATSSGRQIGNNSGVVFRVYGSGGAASSCCNDTTGGCTPATGGTCP